MRKEIIFIFLTVTALFSSNFTTNSYAFNFNLDGPEVSGGIDNMVDLRYYDKTHPSAYETSSVGGWKVGVYLLSDEAGIADIDRFEVVGNNFEMIMKKPDCYGWMGKRQCDYSFWMGHRVNTMDSYIIRGFHKDGTPIHFYKWMQATDFFTAEPLFDEEGNPIMEYADHGTEMPMQVDTFAPKLEPCEVKTVKMNPNGKLVVRFTVPPDLYARQEQVRIRICDQNTGDEEAGVAGDFIADYKYNPPFQIEKADGTIVPNVMRVVFPADSGYAGLWGRVEHRVYPLDAPMYRTVTWFQFPTEQEPVTEE